MRRLIACCGVILCSVAGLVLAGDFKTNVGVVPTLILGGPVDPKGISAWVASTVYKPGEYVTLGAGGPAFVCVSTNSTGASGTSLPGPGIGSDIVDNNVTWRPVLTKARKLLIISNRGSANVTVGLLGTVLGVGTGAVLSASSSIGLSGDDAPQGSVWAISAAGTTNEVGGCER